MSVTDYLNYLPESIWIEILMYLDAHSLLRITETCQQFANFFVGSRKLRDKIRIKVNINDEVALQLQTLMSSQRTYRNLIIECDESIFNPTNQQLEGHILNMIRNLFGETITNLKLKNIFMKLNSIIELLQTFTNLKSCTLEKILMSDHSNFYYNWMDERDLLILKTNSFPFEKLQDLTIRKTDFFCFYFFEKAHCLKKLVIDDLVFDKIDVRYFEKFLIMQADLKELRLRKFRDNYIFQTGLLASPSFQLETLTMNSVYWNDKDRGTAFFKSQRNIKTFELALKNRWYTRWDELMWFNDILKQIFIHNKYLQKIAISTIEKHGYNIKSTDFLEGVVCPRVTDLTYHKGRNDETTALMEAFVKMFPNVKHFTFTTNTDIRTPDLSFLSSWKHLESLAIKEDQCYLRDIYVPNLTSFEYQPFKPFSANLMKNVYDFLKRHPRIRHFKLEGGHSFEYSGTLSLPE